MIEFTTKDGAKTRASTASGALVHWCFRHTPKMPLPDPVPILEAIQVGAPIPGPYEERFLMLALSIVERTFGKAPEIPLDFYSTDWYKGLDQYSDFTKVIDAFESGDPKVIAYEATCQNILEWLELYGDITKLEV